MSESGISVDDIKKKLILDDKFKMEYDKLKSQYEIISKIIEGK